MPSNDPLHSRKAHARAGKFVGSVKPLKRTEELLRIRRIKSRAVVLHKEDHAVVAALSAELNARACMPRSILPRVPQQIIEHDAHEPQIPVSLQAFVNDPLDVARVIRAREIVGDCTSHIREIDGFSFHFEPRKPRKVQQIVD